MFRSRNFNKRTKLTLPCIFNVTAPDNTLMAVIGLWYHCWLGPHSTCWSFLLGSCCNPLIFSVATSACTELEPCHPNHNWFPCYQNGEQFRLTSRSDAQGSAILSGLATVKNYNTFCQIVQTFSFMKKLSRNIAVAYSPQSISCLL